MKILYVKNGSERDKKFQLQTMIYEENGQKFVKKSALCKEALEHLYHMKKNYEKLSDLIINPKVKLAKIIAHDENSLTFEYIEGASLAKQFDKIKNDEKAQKVFIDEYRKFLEKSFKTTTFDSTRVTDTCKRVFGDMDYSAFDGTLCFDGVTNIDLIFSNIIYRDDEIYIIDYEWVFGCSLPISFSLYRSLINKDILVEKYNIPDKLYKDKELHFIEYYVYQKSFFKYKEKYQKKKFTIEERIKTLEQKIQEQAFYIQVKEQQIFEHIQQLQHKESEIQKLNTANRELSRLAESMRIKNRIKSLFQFKKSRDL